MNSRKHQENLDFIEVFSQNWALIFSAMLTIFSLSLGCLFFVPVMFKAEVILSPPEFEETAFLKRGSEEMYEDFLKTAQSFSAREQFFEEYKVAARLYPEKENSTALVAEFDKNLIEKVYASRGDEVGFVLFGYNSEEMIKILDQFVRFIDKKTVRNYLLSEWAKVSVAVRDLERAIARRKKTYEIYKKYRKDGGQAVLENHQSFAFSVSGMEEQINKLREESPSDEGRSMRVDRTAFSSIFFPQKIYFLPISFILSFCLAYLGVLFRSESRIRQGKGIKK